VRIGEGKPLNDAQLDVLVSHWENQQLLGLAPVSSSFASDPPRKPVRASKGSGIAGAERKRRSWDDGAKGSDDRDRGGYPDRDRDLPPVSEEPWGTKHEMTLRKSLSATLNDLSDREGLTDDELNTKVWRGDNTTHPPLNFIVIVCIFTAASSFYSFTTLLIISQLLVIAYVTSLLC
jgi:hypothetical protein